MEKSLGRSRFACMGGCAAVFALGAAQCFAAGPPVGAITEITAGERALLQGHAAEAIAGLRKVVAAAPQNGQAHLLLCRAFYAEELQDPAVAECETALSTLRNDSKAQDWMGRAYGLKAGRAGALTGFSLARKVKTAFETAVDLDPSNSDAVDDLGEFYLEAPSIVGGGVDKASALAGRVQARLPQRAQRLRALIAEKQKDYGTAERELRACAQGPGARADNWVDLGNYYSRRGDPDRAVDAFKHAYAAERAKGPSLVAVAEGLAKTQREPALAARALQEYLSAGAWDDSAPTFKAHTMLGNLLAARGDKAAAKIEFGKALALAPDYAPAKKAMSAL